MELHQVHKTVPPDGVLVLDDLPFEAGEEVNITITKVRPTDADNPYPFRGMPYRYDDPFSPLVPPEDWNILDDRN